LRISAEGRIYFEPPKLRSEFGASREISDKRRSVTGCLCLKRGNEYYLVLETEKSRERPIAGALAIADMIGLRKISSDIYD
jgi:hypothetical protein